MIKTLQQLHINKGLTYFYSKDVIKVITNGRNTGQSSPQIYEKMLLFIKNSPPPKQFKMPLFIYKTKANIADLNETVSLEDAEAVPLEAGKLNDVKVKKAIGGLLNAWLDHLKAVINKATSNTLSLTIEDISD